MTAREYYADHYNDCFDGVCIMPDEMLAFAESYLGMRIATATVPILSEEKRILIRALLEISQRRDTGEIQDIAERALGATNVDYIWGVGTLRVPWDAELCDVGHSQSQTGGGGSTPPIRSKKGKK